MMRTWDVLGEKESTMDIIKGYVVENEISGRSMD